MGKPTLRKRVKNKPVMFYDPAEYSNATNEMNRAFWIVKDPQSGVDVKVPKPFPYRRQGPRPVDIKRILRAEKAKEKEARTPEVSQ